MKIVFATANPHKLQEVNAIAAGSGIEFVLPEGEFLPVENGKTFEENALIKARAACGSRRLTLADDSGLCVEALNGAPGLYSARYAGTQDEKIQKLLKELEGVKNRRAKFVCSMVLLDKDGKVVFETLGECTGEIAFERSGQYGFGYDPIFIVNGYGKTMAELDEAEKNKISHRGRALQSVISTLKNNKKNIHCF